MQIRDVILRQQSKFETKQDRQMFRRAVLTTEGGLQTSSDPLNDVWANRNERRVWHMADGATQPAQVLCRKVSNPYVGLGVIIGYADGSNAKEVLTTDFFLTGAGTNLDGWDDTGPEDLEPGGNKLHWVYTKVITPLATYPDPTGLTVNVISGDYPYLGSRKTFAGSVSYALTQNPNPGEHYLAGLYLDAANTLQVVYGTSVSTATTAPEPSWPAGAFRLSAVLIDDVQTSIDFDTDIFDRRLAWSDEQAGTSGYPFSVITVDPTDPDADYSTVQAAVNAASSGAIIVLGGSTTEAVTITDKALTIVANAVQGATITASANDSFCITITGIASSGCKIIGLNLVSTGGGTTSGCIKVGSNVLLSDITLCSLDATAGSATNTLGIYHTNSGQLNLIQNQVIVTSGTTRYAYKLDSDGSARVFGGYYSGTTGSFRLEHASALLYFVGVPTLSPASVSISAGTATGDFNDTSGNLHTLANTKVILGNGATNAPLNLTARSSAPSSPGAGDIYLDDGTNTDNGLAALMGRVGSDWVTLPRLTTLPGGVWLVDESITKRVYYTSFANALATANDGDTIFLDSDTYAVTTTTITKSITIAGNGPEATILQGSNGANAQLLDIAANSITVVFKDITVDCNAGDGTYGGAIFGDNSGITVILDNAVVKKTGGAPTNGFGIGPAAGTWILRNGAKASATVGTNKYGVFNITGAATINIGAGCEAGGATADVYSDQSGSTLVNFGLLTNGFVDFAGNYARANIQPVASAPILLNGHPLVWQRGTSFAAAADGQYFADRFGYFKSGAMVHTLSQDTSVPALSKIGCLLNYSMLVDCTTVDSSIAAGDYTFIRYIIEGYDWLKLAQQQFTIPFWVSATKTGTYCFAVGNSGSDRSYVAEYTVNAADTWEYKQITVPASPSAGTWDYTTGIGARLFWTLAGGSTYQTTAGAWQTGNFFSTSNQVNACDNTANNFRLIVGDPIPGGYARPIVPNAFGSFQTLKARCQRYAVVLDASSNSADVAQGAKVTTTAVSVARILGVPLRAVPVLTHNVTGYTAGAPGTTTVALIDYGNNGFSTLTGALTLSLAAAGLEATRFSLNAGTSWTGTNGQVFGLRIGPSVVMLLAPTDYS